MHRAPLLRLNLEWALFPRLETRSLPGTPLPFPLSSPTELPVGTNPHPPSCPQSLKTETLHQPAVQTLGTLPLTSQLKFCVPRSASFGHICLNHVWHMYDTHVLCNSIYSMSFQHWALRRNLCVLVNEWTIMEWMRSPFPIWGHLTTQTLVWGTWKEIQRMSGSQTCSVLRFLPL